MQKRKNLFERIPLSEVPMTFEPDATGRRTPAKPAKTNVPKRAARPKRTIKGQQDDHSVGPWIDVEPLRKDRNRAPQIVLREPLSSANSGYFMLADPVLVKKAKLKQK